MDSKAILHTHTALVITARRLPWRANESRLPSSALCGLLQTFSTIFIILKAFSLGWIHFSWTQMTRNTAQQLQLLKQVGRTLTGLQQAQLTNSLQGKDKRSSPSFPLCADLQVGMTRGFKLKGRVYVVTGDQSLLLVCPGIFHYFKFNTT